MKEKSIFMITTFNADKSHIRCVGYYNKFEYAEECIKINNGNIYENGYYPYAVIEEVEPGIYPLGKNKWFYEWGDQFDHENGYKKCKFEDVDRILFAPIG
jgi:hypothetical protein